MRSTSRLPEGLGRAGWKEIPDATEGDLIGNRSAQRRPVASRINTGLPINAPTESFWLAKCRWIGWQRADDDATSYCVYHLRCTNSTNAVLLASDPSQHKEVSFLRYSRIQRVVLEWFNSRQTARFPGEVPERSSYCLQTVIYSFRLIADMIQPCNSVVYIYIYLYMILFVNTDSCVPQSASVDIACLIHSEVGEFFCELFEMQCETSSKLHTATRNAHSPK